MDAITLTERLHAKADSERLNEINKAAEVLFGHVQKLPHTAKWVSLENLKLDGVWLGALEADVKAAAFESSKALCRTRAIDRFLSQYNELQERLGEVEERI